MGGRAASFDRLFSPFGVVVRVFAGRFLRVRSKTRIEDDTKITDNDFKLRRNLSID